MTKKKKIKNKNSLRKKYFLPNFIYQLLKYQLIILVGIFVALEFMLSWQLYKTINSPKQNCQQKISHKAITGQIEKIETNLAGRSHLNGLSCVEGEENLPPVAVIIDNQSDAWPNYGLSQAKLVYETLVEGGVTRLLAFYTPNIDKDIDLKITKIGPVRSARPYFVQLVKEYGALLAHAGGSPQALKLIEKLKIHNLEQIAWWGPDYFWRVYSRQAPHNLFTSGHKLAQAVIDWKLNKITPDYRPWKFNQLIKDNKLPAARIIKINFSENKKYNVSYKYDNEKAVYLRWQNKNKHIDALTKQQITTKNLVIQMVPPVKILDSLGRLELNLIGQGQAIIFRDGKEITGKWIKSNQESRTIFYDKQGQEIYFKPGNIWIEIVPEDKQVEVE